MQENTGRKTIYYLSLLLFLPSLSYFSSYPPWCTPCPCFLHLCLPHDTSLLVHLLLLHADLVPTAQPLATPPRSKGCPRSPSQIPDYCFVEGGGRGGGGSGSGKWGTAEPGQDWDPTGPQTTQEERAQAQEQGEMSEER